MDNNYSSLQQPKYGNHHTMKHNLINRIIELNEIAVEVFGVKLLDRDELNNLELNDLKNIKTELRIQIGFKRDRWI